MGGTFHTHPYSVDEGGYENVSFSCEDINFLTNNHSGKYIIVMAGGCIYIMMIGDTKKSKKCADCCDKWKKGFNASQSVSFQKCVESGVKKAIKDCGLCYYESCNKDGKFPEMAILKN